MSEEDDQAAQKPRPWLWTCPGCGGASPRPTGWWRAPFIGGIVLGSGGMIVAYSLGELAGILSILGGR